MKLQKLIREIPLISLAVVSLTCGVVWRAEIEIHGWGGLVWLSYFHFAIPLGLGVFFVYANILITDSRFYRISLNVFGIWYVFVILLSIDNALQYMYATGFVGMMLKMQTPDWAWYIQEHSLYAILPLMPLGTYYILKMHSQFLSKKYLVVSVLCMTLSVPISLILIKLFEPVATPDFINCLKTGMLFPFIIGSNGLLIVGVRKYSERTEQFLDR